MHRRTTLVLIVIMMLTACAPAATPDRPATPTALPMLNASPAPPTSGSQTHAFHVNFAITQSTKCGDTPCDTVYVPKLLLYLRGDVTVQADGALSGDGELYFTEAEPCVTLRPDLSSCSITRATRGRISIDGERQGDQLTLKLRLIELPHFGVTMTTQHPVQGQIDVPYDSTYDQEIKQVLIAAHVFDTPFTVSPALNARSNAHLFEGRYEFGNPAAPRITQVLGGLFFIPVDTTLPEPLVP